VEPIAEDKEAPGAGGDDDDDASTLQKVQ